MTNLSLAEFQRSAGPEGVSVMAMHADLIEAQARAIASRSATLSSAPAAPLPPWVDHSVHVKYIREQGAWGCGLNAQAACWDILLDKYCFPYLHPNISVNRMLWAQAWTLRCWPENVACDKRTTLPIPGPAGTTYPTVDAYLNAMGCPTEGTEPTNSDGVQWPTDAGNAECPNYRLDRHPDAVGSGYCRDVAVDLNELKYWLKGGPVRVGLTPVLFKARHFVTLVGYDDSTRQLKFLNSWGDRFGQGGFGYLDYDSLGVEVESAQVYQFVPPPTAVSCARIRFTSEWRQDVHLWVGLTGTKLAKRVWPSGQRQDDSRNLWFTVTLPPEFGWPPSPQNRLFLDVYDTGAQSRSGGAILEFSAHFNDQHRFCSEILQGTPDPDNPGAGSGIVPRQFGPQELVRVTIE